MLLGGLAAALESFVVRDIRLEGLQRVSAGSVFVALPVSIGEQLDEERIQQAIRGLFKTGQFDNISMLRDGNVLIVSLTERPSISEIILEGNKNIKDESLLDGLNQAGIREGNVLRRDTLRSIETELLHQYVSQGRYDATVDVSAVSLTRNRAQVRVDIDEGSSARIRDINLIGNRVFSSAVLMGDFKLAASNWLSWMRNDDKYSREKLQGDIETLTSYYLDRGYLKFSVESTEVAITSNREGVYITININEGDIFTVGDVRLIGDIPMDEKLLRPVILLQSGRLYSQQFATGTEESLKRILNNNGYTFAKVRSVTQDAEAEGVADVSFIIEPGRRTYVRRISFKGNERTDDEVLRREMRQMEGTWASDAQIEYSKTRLDRLGFFRSVEVDTAEVPGQPDQIDINFDVKEEFTSSIGGGIGYNTYGYSLGFDFKQTNFLGAGTTLDVTLNSSDYSKQFNFRYFDPYFTLDGVSRVSTCTPNNAIMGKFGLRNI